MTLIGVKVLKLRKRYAFIVVITSALLGGLSGDSLLHAQTTSFALSDSTRQISACFIDAPITMDGILDEACWEAATVMTDFVQSEPDEGAPATERTEVKILYDQDNIYVGVTCYDSEPDRIIHNQMQVDGFLEDDDNITIIFDTFNDSRGGFYFRTNPNGARADAKIGGSRYSRRRRTSTNQRSMTNIHGLGVDRVSYDWNGIWDVSARITPEGWVAEIVIPFSTLRFRTVDIQNWGVNVRRIIKRKNELILWTAWGRDDGLMQLSKAGQLCDLRNIEGGNLLEVKPYVLAGLEKEAGRDLDDNLKSGIDIKYGITSNLILDFTSFTDFAQVEADQTVINLTRFDIRYPEKREFFLEGAELFDYGTLHTTPFYSRNIGLTPDREQVPILAGVKVTGKVGSYNIGVLDMQTDEEGTYPSTNYGVVRVKKDILEKSSVGFIATSVYDTDEHADRVLGVDFAYVTDSFLRNKNLEIAGDYSQNFKEGIDSENRSGRLLVRYPNDLFQIFTYGRFVDENYNPDMGFVDRRDIWESRFRIGYNPRPDIPRVQQMHFIPADLSFITSKSGKLLTRELLFSPFGVTTSSQDVIAFYVKNTFDYLDEDFNIFSDVFIPMGDYDWWSYQATMSTNPGRPLSFNAFLEMGDFYSGSKTTVENGLTYNMNRYFGLAADIVNNHITIGSRDFDTMQYGLRLNTNFSTRLYARTYVQWNNDDKLANLNFRVQFIPQIGSDVFFVYNQIWDGYRDYQTTFNTAIMKIAYRIAF